MYLLIGIEELEKLQSGPQPPSAKPNKAKVPTKEKKEKKKKSKSKPNEARNGAPNAGKRAAR
jgi:hypothetical protein